MRKRYLKRVMAFLLTLAMLCTSSPLGGGVLIAEAAEPEVEAAEAVEAAEPEAEAPETDTETVEATEPGVTENPGDEANAGDEAENDEKNVADAVGDVTSDAANEETDNNDNDEADDEVYWKGVVFESADELVDIWKNTGLLWEYEEGESPYEEKFKYASDLDTLFSELAKGEDNGETDAENTIDVEYVYIAQCSPEVSDKTITVPATVKGLLIGNGNYESEDDGEPIDFGVIANELYINGTETSVYFEKGLYIDANEGDFTIVFSSTEANNSRVIFGDNTVNGAVSCGSKNAGADMPETILVYGDFMLNGFINEGGTKFDASIGYSPDENNEYDENDEYDGSRDSKFLIKDAANGTASVKGVTFNEIYGDTDGNIIYNGYPEGEDIIDLLPTFNERIDLGSFTVVDEEGNEVLDEDGNELEEYRSIGIRFWQKQDKPFFLGEYFDEDGEPTDDWWEVVDAEELTAGTRVATFAPSKPGENPSKPDNQKARDIAERVYYYNHSKGDEQDLYINVNGVLVKSEEYFSAYSIVPIEEDVFSELKWDPDIILNEFGGSIEQVDSLENLFETHDSGYVAILVNEAAMEDENYRELIIPAGIEGAFIWPRTEDWWKLKGISANEGCRIILENASIDSSSQNFKVKINSGNGQTGQTSNRATVEFFESAVYNGVDISGNADVSFINSYADSDVNVSNGADLYFADSTVNGNVTAETNSDSTISIFDFFVANGVKNFSLFEVDSYATFVVANPDEMEFNDIQFNIYDKYADDNEDTGNVDEEDQYNFFFNLVYNGYPDDVPVFKGGITENFVDETLKEDGRDYGVSIKFVKYESSFWESEEGWESLENEELEVEDIIAKIEVSGDNADEVIDSLLRKIWYDNQLGYGTKYRDGFIVVSDGFAYRVYCLDGSEHFEAVKEDMMLMFDDEEGWIETDSPAEILSDGDLEYVAIQAMKPSHRLEDDKILTLPENIKGAMLVASGDDEEDTFLPWKLNELVVEGKAEVNIYNVEFEPEGQEFELTIEYAGDSQDFSDKTTVSFYESGVAGNFNISGKANLSFFNLNADGNVKVSDGVNLYFADSIINGSVTAPDNSDANITISDMFIASGVKNFRLLMVDSCSTFIVRKPDEVKLNDIELLVHNKDGRDDYEFYFDIVYNGHPKNTSVLPAFNGSITQEIMDEALNEEEREYGVNIRFVKTSNENFWKEDNWWDNTADAVLAKDALVATTTVKGDEAVEAFMKKIGYTAPKQYTDNVWIEYEENGDKGGNIVVRYAEGVEPDVDPDVDTDPNPDPDDPDEEEVDPDIKPVITAKDVLFPGKKATYEAVYTGEQIRPAMVVSYTYTENGKTKSQKLKLNVDYTLTYSNNVNASTGSDASDGTENKKTSVIVKGIGEYSGKVEMPFTIKPKSIEKVKLSPVGDIMYTEGEAPDPVVVVTDGTYELVEGVDYEVKLSPEKGSPTADTQVLLTVKGKGNYDSATTSKSSAKFNILAPIQGSSDIKPISAESVKVELKIPAKGYTYNGKQQKPKVVVTDGGVKVPASQYKVIYSNNVNACKADAENAATVRVVGVTKKGKGYYGVTAPVKFEIKQKDFAKVKVTSVPNIPLTGKVSNITLTVKEGKHILTEGEEFTVDYSTIKNENGSIKEGIKTGQKYTITLYPVKDKNYTEGSKKEVTVKFGQLNLGSKTAKTKVTITDPAQSKVEVVYNGVTLKDGTDYTATVKHDKNKSTYTVTIKAVKGSAYKGKKVFKGVSVTTAPTPDPTPDPTE